MFAKYALPTAPNPRGANISPPVQHRVANIDVKIDKKLSTFSFIKISLPRNTIYTLVPTNLYL